MTMADIKDWLAVLASGGMILLAIALLYLRSQFVPREEGSRASAKIEALEDRVSKMEGELDHLPDKDVTHRLEMAIARLDGKFEILDERLKPVASVMTRMQDYLMDDRK